MMTPKQVQNENAELVSKFLKTFHYQWRVIDAAIESMPLLLLTLYIEFMSWILSNNETLRLGAVFFALVWFAVTCMNSVANRLGPLYASDPRLFKRHSKALIRYIQENRYQPI